MRKQRRHPGAFTLFEMMVVIAIFVLLAGGIYSIVDVSVRATAALTDDSLQSQRLDAFISLLRRTFHNLPATARLTGGVRVQDGDGSAEIVLRDAPGIFAWGSVAPSAGAAVISARPRLGGGRGIGLLLVPGNPTEMEWKASLEKGPWLPLLPDLRSVSWRFYSASLQDWVEEWTAEGERPPLVELTFQFLGEEVPRTYTFWLPPVKEASAAPAQPEPTPEQPSQDAPQP
ncbi:MAG: prepilin-type N-terminal cleavage/methylation domain-containing protein [Chthoniobacterales bacterium]|nr:prepilin-type N-terminal cleavage/methylation domain-containing protein [Chthoniobacterales bacterium]